MMKDGVILANAGHFDIELDLARCAASVARREIRDNLEEFEMQDGRRRHRRRAVGQPGSRRGHPADVMDMSFANQALAAEYLVEREDLEARIYTLPGEIDDEVARIKLELTSVGSGEAHRGAGRVPVRMAGRDGTSAVGTQTGTVFRPPSSGLLCHPGMSLAGPGLSRLPSLGGRNLCGACPGAPVPTTCASGWWEGRLRTRGCGGSWCTAQVRGSSRIVRRSGGSDGRSSCAPISRGPCAEDLVLRQLRYAGRTCREMA